MTNGKGASGTRDGGVGRRAAVEVIDLDKRFPGVHALRAVTLDFREGEIHSVIGENGAGKSTLVNILAGLLPPDSGSVVVSGRPVTFKNPRSARRGGVSVVPQEVHVIPTFSVARTTTLGLEPFWVSRSRLTRRDAEPVRDALAQVGAATLPVDRPMADASVAELRLCQVARTLLDPGLLIILDEPTAALSEADAEALLARLVALRDQGRSILYVSHRLDEVLSISDRITVLRDGAVVGTFAADEVDRDRLVHLMARDTKLDAVVDEAARAPARGGLSASGTPALRVTDVASAPALRGVSFEVMPGQVVGIAGVQGSGHRAVLEALMGTRRVDAGAMFVDAEPVMMGSVKAAYTAGIRLVPEERRERGVVGCQSLRENVALGYVDRKGRGGLRRHRAERAEAQRMVDNLAIHTPGLETPVENLSGGNQQKVVLARMLVSRPRVMLLSEPTQGIDVRAKAQILRLIRRLAREHAFGIVLASSEFEELLQYADVIHVMSEGRMVATFQAGEASYRDILAAALP